MLIFVIVITGFVVAAAGSLLFMQHYIGPVTWMTMTGLGLYMGFIPFNCIFFERLIATFKYVSNVGFIIYVADSFGYVGSVGIMLVKNLSNLQLSWSRFFMDAVLGMSVLGILMMLGAYRYFRRKYRGIVTVSLVHP